MNSYRKTTRRLLTARSVLVLFGLQIALLVASMAQDVPSSFKEGIFDGIILLVTKEISFVYAAMEYLLFSPNYAGDLDPLLVLLVIPFVYYITAVVAAIPGRTAYQAIQKRLTQ